VLLKSYSTWFKDVHVSSSMPYFCLFKHVCIAGNMQNFENEVLLLSWQTCPSAIHTNKVRNFLDPAQSAVMYCLKSWNYILELE